MTRLIARRKSSEASQRASKPPEPASKAPAPQTPWEKARRLEDHGLWDAHKPVVIGIDQSLVRFALVALCPADKTYLLATFRPKTKGVRRLLDIERFLDWTLQEIKLRSEDVFHICMEGYSYGSKHQREAMGECGGLTKVSLVRAFGSLNKVSYPTIVSPNDLKKFVTGHAVAEKSLMLKTVYRKWGVDLDDDNLADAYAAARVAAGIVTGDTDHQYEADILQKLERHTEWQPPEHPPQTARSRSSGKAKTPSSG